MGLFKSLFNFLRFNNKNWKAVVLCLFAATVFWFFNALNKSYSANINFPVSFEYDSGYIPVKPLPEQIKLNVSGIGWQLFRRSVGWNISSLTIPMENPDTKKILGSTLPAFFSTQLEGLQVNYVLKDTLFVNVEKKIDRKVVVHLKSAEQYIQNDFGISSAIEIIPDRIEVDGPLSVVKELPDTVFLTLPSRNINSDFNDELTIQLDSDLVRKNPSTVNIRFSVGRLMEVTDTATLQIINLPKEVKSLVHLREVSYTYNLPVSHSDSISSQPVIAILDLTGFTRGKHRIIPRITGLPKFSKLIRIDTVDVNF